MHSCTGLIAFYSGFIKSTAIKTVDVRAVEQLRPKVFVPVVRKACHTVTQCKWFKKD